MDEVFIFSGLFDDDMSLPFAVGGIKAGFPSPAQDYMSESLDFNRDMIAHPDATFYARVRGDSMRDAGISNGDIIVIDKAVEPKNGDIVVAYIDGEFTLKYIDLTERNKGKISLVPANENYKPIEISETDNFTVWGVVVWTIKRPCRNMNK